MNDNKTIRRWLDKLLESVKKTDSNYEHSPAVISTHAQANRTDDEEYRAHDRRYKNRQTFTNYAVAAFTLVTAGVGLWQGSMTRQALDSSDKNSMDVLSQMKEQSNAAKIAAEAATSAAKTSANTLIEIRNNGSDTHQLAKNGIIQASSTQDLANATQAVNRPYVGFVSMGDIRPSMNNTSTLPLFSRNFGTVPAENVKIRVLSYINGWHKIDTLGDSRQQEPATIMPGQIDMVEVVYKMPQSKELLTPANTLLLCVTYTYNDPSAQKKSYTLTQEFDSGWDFFGNTDKRTWITTSSCPAQFQ